MTIDVDQYKRLRAKVEKAKSDIDKAEGSLEQLMGKLLTDFECNILEEAEIKYIKLVSEREKLESQYDKELEEFEEKFGERI